MLKKIINKLTFWKPKEEPEPPLDPEFELVDYGIYRYKPVIARALSEVMGISQDQVVELINVGQNVYVNDIELDASFAVHPDLTLLQSGKYIVKVLSTHSIYKFRIQ